MAIMWITSTTATATSSTAITSTSTDQILADRAGNTWTGGSIGLLAARGYTDVTVMLLTIVSAISASLSPSGKAVQDICVITASRVPGGRIACVTPSISAPRPVGSGLSICLARIRSEE